MKNITKILCLLVALATAAASAQTTAFTYQGRLNDNGFPAEGNYDFQFTLYDALDYGNPVGNPVTLTAVPVTNGVFSATLDFGAAAFPGAGRWLQIGVRTNGAEGGLVLLSPRETITSSPYAVQALTATSAGSVAAGNVSGVLNVAQIPSLDAAKIASGTIADGRLSGNIPLLTGNNLFTGSNTVAGAFVGNGSGITNVNLRTADSLGAITWTPKYGSFVFGATVTAAVAPEGMVAADLNGDGLADLVSASGDDGVLRVMTNNGSGSFVLSAVPRTGVGPRAMALADVNGDGKPDLVTANETDDTLTVLVNNGNGRFSRSTTPLVGAVPRAVVAADVNGDGKPDLISADSGANTVSVLINNGSGGLGRRRRSRCSSSRFQWSRPM